MKPYRGQGGLFPHNNFSGGISGADELDLSKELLESWQKRLHAHQSKLFKSPRGDLKQGSLFETDELKSLDTLRPLKLTPLPISFWRWPSAPHSGPAIYLVMDLPEGFNTPILLYVGETTSADRRWKGEHDCKEYLASYSHALAQVGLKSHLSIRFWIDVPESTKERRKMEKKLILLWLPPFNKETRAHWSTPFTAINN